MHACVLHIILFQCSIGIIRRGTARARLYSTCDPAEPRVPSVSCRLVARVLTPEASSLSRIAVLVINTEARRRQLLAAGPVQGTRQVRVLRTALLGQLLVDDA